MDKQPESSQREDGASGNLGRSTKPKRRPSQAKTAKTSQPKSQNGSVPVRCLTSSIICQIPNECFRALPTLQHLVQLQELLRRAQKHPKRIGQGHLRLYLQQPVLHQNLRDPHLQTPGLLKVAARLDLRLINTSIIVLLFLS